MRFLTAVVFLSLVLVNQAFCDLQIITEPNIAWQGKIVRVKLAAPEGVSTVKGSFLGQKFLCYKSGDDYRGIIGIPINQKPGYYNLRLIITHQDGRSETLTKRMKLWSTRFPFSKFWLTPAKDKLRAREIIDNEWVQIEKSLIVANPIQLWQGKFIKPVEAEITQGFGHRQIINRRRAGSHRGVDFKALVGTKVRAPNRGKVVFVKRLKAFGGTLVLDHGQGIHTLYFHLSKVFPKVGDEIKKGDIIALSGDSGVSSGAHLHWGMSVHNLRVDPLQWIKYEI
jgi:murein DD-endopeptidase MepM/ murein hydrolase activator NlpD